MTTENQLLPCPCCGSPAKLIRTKGESLWGHDQVEWTQAQCTNEDCGITTENRCEGWEPTPAETWNARAALTHPAQPAEGLRTQHDADSAELRRLCQDRDDARRERDAAKAEIAGLESSVGHLSAMVDAQTRLVQKAVAIMKTLHESAAPIDGPDMDACIPGRVFHVFVDGHAELMHALHTGPQITTPQPAEGGEAVYQCQGADGRWTDQSRQSYDYNVKHGGGPVRVLYAAPPASQEQAENRELRRLLCAAHAGAAAYMDDGEAQDSSTHPAIDYLRDSLDDIKAKRMQRASQEQAGCKHHFTYFGSSQPVLRCAWCDTPYAAIQKQMLNGLTEAETSATASVMGLTASQEQAAFESWLASNCPSGDVESVQRQWESSHEYAELHASQEQAQQPSGGEAQRIHTAWEVARHRCKEAINEHRGFEIDAMVDATLCSRINDAFHDLHHALATPKPEPMTEHQRGNLVMEHLGPAALAGDHMSPFDAFTLGIEATERHHGITKGEA